MDLSPRRLDTLLIALDLTNDDLATLSGVTQRTVYRWLAGTTPVARSVIVMLELMQQARA